MRYPAKLINLILILLIIAVSAIAGETEVLRDENRLLDAELKLARKQQIYFIFDMKERKIFLKVKGEIFKEFPMETARSFANGFSITPSAIRKKSTFMPPVRKELKPQDETKDESKEQTAFKLDALEIDDMPTSYRLYLDDGVVISIRPKPTNIGSSLLSIWNSMLWYITSPLKTLYHAILGHSFGTLDISLGARDCQGLYWAAHEGMGAVVYIPAR